MPDDAGFALIKMLGGLGSFLGPSLIGELSDAEGGSYAAALIVLAACLVLASVMQIFFRQPGELAVQSPSCPATWLATGCKPSGSNLLPFGGAAKQKVFPQLDAVRACG